MILRGGTWKFLVCILSRSRDISRVANLKSTSRDRGPPPFDQIFIFRLSIPYPQFAWKVWVLYFQPFRIYIRGSKNLKSRSRDLGHAPIWTIFHFLNNLQLLSIQECQAIKLSPSCMYVLPTTATSKKLFRIVRHILTHKRTKNILSQHNAENPLIVKEN